MKKIFLIIIFLISSCSAGTFHFYKEEFNEIAQDPKDRKSLYEDKDLGNLHSCQYLLDLSEWSESKSRWGKSWWQNNVWRKSNLNIHKNYGLNLKGELSNQIIINKSLYPIYIGPWQYSADLEKNIRFFAYYPKEGGKINYQYESQTPENQKIPQKKFSLSPSAKIAPDRFSLCVVKWIANFGYNAVAEIKSRNFLSSDYLVPTGNVIDYKTGEIITKNAF